MKMLYNVPLAERTTFKIGGAADHYIKCEREGDIFSAFQAEGEFGNGAYFILGGASNVLAADEGFRGTIIDTASFSGSALYNADGGFGIKAFAGTRTDDLANFAAKNSLGGLEFLAGLPGTVGGAIFMNARCYEKSISDVLVKTEYIEIPEISGGEGAEIKALVTKKEDWSYKKSPFQAMKAFIVAGYFCIQMGNGRQILKTMMDYRADRERKGHFSYPSAGSIFKNNHEWGKSTGKIIEELGLRGRQIGGARIADWHGNFIINTGGARAEDVKALISLAEERAFAKLGIHLEREVIFV